MGTLENFDLDKYGCDTFVETGTGKGEGLSYAKQFTFKRLHSIEISKPLWKECLKFDDTKTLVWFGCSDLILDVLFRKILKESPKILFWLDAHFPGKDYGMPEEGHPDYIEKPLYKELETIIKHRGLKDVIIIDDVRIYDKEKIREFLPNVQFLDFDEGYAISESGAV